MAGTLIRTVCGLPDYMRCGLSVEVQDGVITRILPGDFPDPADRGICLKALAAREMVYHPDRLKYPLKRTGERGEGKWRRVSWDEALTAIASQLGEIGQRYGPNAVAWMISVMPNLSGGGYCRLASLTKGTVVDWWSCGDAAGPCADVATFGHMMGAAHLLSDPNPRFVIVWGYNPAETNYDHMRKIVRAKRKGAKVIVIDPRFTATAAHADEHIPLRPGTDGALALGMINVILQEGLRDKRFIAENTNGPLLVRRDNGLFLKESDVTPGGKADAFMVMDEYSGRRQVAGIPQAKPAINGSFTVADIDCQPAFQLLSDMVKEYTPENVAKITEVPADVIRRLAVGYGSRKPASIFRGWGMQRTFHGDLACRAINALAAITGNLTLERLSTFVLNSRQFLYPGGPTNILPVMLLYDAVTKNQPQAVKAVWCSAHDFVNQMPNMNRLIGEVLPRLDLIVVCDLFMTPSARFADYVLPVASFFESTDLCIASFYHTYLQLQQKAIEPQYECKSDFQIAAELGKRLGYDQYFNKTEERYIEELLSSRHPTMEGISLADLKEGPVMARQIDRAIEFRTPTGLVELYVQRLKRFGQELPIFLEPAESPRSEQARTYPLTLLTTHSRYRIHSTLARIPSLLAHETEPILEINPADARPREITDGDSVRVYNSRGQVRLKAKLSHQIKPGVVNVTQGWWPEQYSQGHHNELTHERVNPVQQFILSPNAAFYDVLVQVERAE
ncbi:MAG: molybdopterin-dependent oxidoreductase [Dehalococcoidia bacterium]|nr:molybdopterin-dependent oxidoreductase [Dehalococcoidia bacterium]